jgi:hypothetical protein
VADFDIQGKITYDTTQATTALKGVSQAAGETAKQTEKVGEATQKSQVQIGQFGSALGLAGQAAGQLSPALGSVVSVAGSATGVIQGLTTAGLGPLGIAISAISVAVTAGVGLWKSWSDEQKKAADSIRQNALPALDELISRLEREKSLRETKARLARGEGTAVEQAGFRVEAEQYLTVAGERFASVSERFRREEQTLSYARSRGLAAVNQYQEELAAARAELERANAVVEYRMQLEQEVAEREERPTTTTAPTGAPTTAPITRGGGGGGGGRGGGARRPTLEQLMAQAGGGGALSLEGLNMETLGRGDDNWMAEQDNARAKQAVADEAAAAEKLRLAEEVSKERQRIEDEMNSALLGSLESALSSSVDAWLSGTRSMGEAMQDMVKQVAKSLASEAIIQGLKETALGIGALATGSPTAAIHFAAAGKWAAVGAAAGLVGAASGAFGGGGGGGGAGPAAATGGPALTAGAATGAGTTVVINWGSSGLVYAADRAQLGRDISGMISEAHGRLGRGM